MLLLFPAWACPVREDSAWQRHCIRRLLPAVTHWYWFGNLPRLARGTSLWIPSSPAERHFELHHHCREAPWNTFRREAYYYWAHHHCYNSRGALHVVSRCVTARRVWSISPGWTSGCTALFRAFRDAITLQTSDFPLFFTVTSFCGKSTRAKRFPFCVCPFLTVSNVFMFWIFMFYFVFICIYFSKIWI